MISVCCNSSSLRGNLSTKGLQPSNSMEGGVVSDQQWAAATYVSQLMCTGTEGLDWFLTNNELQQHTCPNLCALALRAWTGFWPTTSCSNIRVPTYVHWHRGPGVVFDQQWATCVQTRVHRYWGPRTVFDQRWATYASQPMYIGTEGSEQFLTNNERHRWQFNLHLNTWKRTLVGVNKAIRNIKNILPHFCIVNHRDKEKALTECKFRTFYVKTAPVTVKANSEHVLSFICNESSEKVWTSFHSSHWR